MGQCAGQFDVVGPAVDEGGTGLGQGASAVLRRGGAGQHRGLRRAHGLGLGVEAQGSGHDRQGGQCGVGGIGIDGPVVLAGDRSGTDEHDVGESAQDPEDLLVAVSAESGRRSVAGRGTVERGDHVDSHVTPRIGVFGLGVGVEPAQLAVVDCDLGRLLDEVHPFIVHVVATVSG